MSFLGTSSSATAAAPVASASAPPLPPRAQPIPQPAPPLNNSISSISESDIHALLAYFWSFNPSTTPRDSPDLVHIHSIVTRLFAQDYDLALIDNDWCSSYPQQLIIPTRQLASNPSEAPVNNPTTLVPLFRNSRFSRVRSRFVVPVLVLNGRNICRSSTLSNEAEVQLNSIAEKAKYLKRQLFSSSSSTTSAAAADASPAGRPRSPASPPPPFPASSTSHPSSDTDDMTETTLPPLSTMERQRLADIALLRALQVTDIFDLMVENRKVKAFFTITSSEKADTRNRYAEFAVVPIPYPGVEFFEDFKSRGYCGKELRFDWMQAFADAELKVERAGAWRRPARGKGEGGGLIGEAPPVQVLSSVDLWKEWRNWDIIRMTQHYLQLILHSLVAPAPPSTSTSTTASPRPTSPALPDSTTPPPPPQLTDSTATAAPPPLSGNGGINIHCISGWDRTPAFISWVRLSLWADGLAHQSLCAEEILYLTVAYDWLLFSHLLADRVKNSQEIFAFCFYMLLYILDAREFGVADKVQAESEVQGKETMAQTSVGAKHKRTRMPTLSTSAPTSTAGADLEHPESSPTLSDFAHTPQSPSLSTSMHHHHSVPCPTRPVDVPAMRRHHLPRRASNASTSSCNTPPFAPSMTHPPPVASSPLFTLSGGAASVAARRTSHGHIHPHGDSTLLLAAGAGTGTNCSDSISSAASSLCSVPCQLDGSAPPGSMINGRTPAPAPAAVPSASAGSVQYSSSWQLISYMQQQAQQQLAGSQGSVGATPKRHGAAGGAGGRPRAPSTGSLGRGQHQHRYSHSWTLEEDDHLIRAGGVAGSVSPAIAPSLGLLAASPHTAAHGHRSSPRVLMHSSSSPPALRPGPGSTPPASPTLDHEHTDPTFDDDEGADADEDIDDVDDLEFANARREHARKPTTPSSPAFAHGRPPPAPAATAAAAPTGSWSWTVASKETTPSPVVVPSVPPAPAPPAAPMHHHHLLSSSSSSSSSARSSRWSLGTSGAVTLAAPQALPVAVNGARGSGGVGFPVSTANHTPVAVAVAGTAHRRGHGSERKRTMSLSGSWDPNMSPTTMVAAETGAESRASGGKGMIARPVSTPVAGAREPRIPPEGAVEFAPFSACACCQMPGTAANATGGAGEDEDLFAMDGSLMLVPGPPGCDSSHTESLSSSTANLASPVPRSSTGGEDDAEDLESSSHDDTDPPHDRKLDNNDRAATPSPPTSSSSASFTLLSSSRAQRLLRVRNLFVQAYRPLAQPQQPITAPPLSAKDWPPLPSRPSPVAVAVSAPSLAGAPPDTRARMGVSPPPAPAVAMPGTGVLQPQPINVVSGGGGGRWTSSLSSMMAKMAGVPHTTVTVSQPLLARANGTCSPPAAPLAPHVPPPPPPAPPSIHAHYMQPLTSLLPSPPMSTGNHPSSSSSLSTSAGASSGSASHGGVLTMPPSWRSMHHHQQQLLHRATSPAAGTNAALSPSAPASMMGSGGGGGYAHHYMSPLVSPIGGASPSRSGVFRTSAAAAGDGNGSGGAGGGGASSGFRDSWFR